MTSGQKRNLLTKPVDELGYPGLLILKLILDQMMEDFEFEDIKSKIKEKIIVVRLEINKLYIINNI
jgi:hypothetical protein